MDRVARFETHWAYISRRWYRRDSTRDLSEGRRRRRRRKARTISGTETFPAISCRASFYRRPMLFEWNPVVPPFQITGRRRKRKLVVPRKFIAKRLLRRFIYTPRMIFTKRGNIFLENGWLCYCCSFHRARNDSVGFRGKIGNGIGDRL